MKKFLVIALMSVLTSGVNAQTSTKKSDIIKIEQSDSIRIMHAINKNNRLDEDDIDIVQSLLKHKNEPLEGGIAEDDIIVEGSQYGDVWKAFISYYKGGYYLTYIITRDDEKQFIGRLDIRIE